MEGSKMDVNQIICRICMVPKSNMVSIFSESNLSLKLVELADVQVEEGDGLPSAICTDCEGDLEKCYEFRGQVRWSDEKLREDSLGSQIALEEYNIKLEKDHGVCETMIEEEKSSDVGDYNNENETQSDLEEETAKDIEEDVCPQVSHVEILENQREDINVINDPSGLEEPLIEAAHMKSEVGPPDDPLKFVKVETTEPMDTDNCGASTSALSSSTVFKSLKSLRAGGDERINEMCLNKRFELNNEGDELPLHPQKGKEWTIFNKQNQTKSTPIHSYENADYSEFHCNLLLNFKSKPTQFYENYGPELETCTNKSYTTLSDNPHFESTNFSNTLSLGSESRPTAVDTRFEYFGDGFKSDIVYKDITNYSEYKALTDKEYKCRICNCTFNSINSLDEHNSTAHIVSVDVECNLCHRTFKDKRLLSNHMRCCENRVKTKGTEYICPECGILFKSLQSLTRHEKRFHSEIDRKIMCDVCGCIFKFQTHLTYHKSFMHPADKDKVTCDICGKEFICQIRLNKHMRSTHCSVRKYVCSICQMSFKDKKTLDVHVTVHSAEKAFKCDVCQSAFRTKYKLKVHLSCHTNDQFKCNYCNKVFMVKKNYNHHVKNCNKSQSQRFSCDICDKEFHNLSQFDLHMKFHINPNMDLFMCDLCGKCFDSKVKCEKHRFYHGLDNKSLQCSVCSKIFKTNKILKNHMFLHTTDAFLYKCEICGKPFKHSGAFHSHQRVHKNEVHYECNLCYENFKWKQTYDKHMLKCHKLKQSTSEQTIIDNKSEGTS